MFGSPSHLTSVPDVPSLAILASVVASPFVSGKFVELSELLSSNIAQTQLDSGPELFFNGCLTITSISKMPKRRMDDAGGWLEAFSVYCLLLTSSLTLPAVDLADL